MGITVMIQVEALDMPQKCCDQTRCVFDRAGPQAPSQ